MVKVAELTTEELVALVRRAVRAELAEHPARRRVPAPERAPSPEMVSRVRRWLRRQGVAA